LNSNLIPSIRVTPFVSTAERHPLTRPFFLQIKKVKQIITIKTKLSVTPVGNIKNYKNSKLKRSLNAFVHKNAQKYLKIVQKLDKLTKKMGKIGYEV